MRSAIMMCSMHQKIKLGLFKMRFYFILIIALFSLTHTVFMSLKNIIDLLKGYIREDVAENVLKIKKHGEN